MQHTYHRTPHDWVQGPGYIGFPYFWQVPAATEKAAWESVVATPGVSEFTYLGFPWATLIDGLAFSSATCTPLLQGLHCCGKRVRPETPGGRLVTVCQHIHGADFRALFTALGLTDVFWSHATTDVCSLGPVRVHPFPLYPVQTAARSDGETRRHSRRYLANFIGAYTPGLYLSDVRQRIFELAGTADDLLIVQRERWHFNRKVYDEQIRRERPDTELLGVEQTREQEFKAAVQNSWFTLCPSGSGPNSIRVYESLALGSIPIILTENLRLPGSLEHWKRAAIIEEDSSRGLEIALHRARASSMEQRLSMLRAGQNLYVDIAPPKYADLIDKTLQGAAHCSAGEP